MKESEVISIKKARMHNLKEVSVDIPRNKFVVVTGPSGSGKSSLAFDTVYAEGQRRYIESLSSYARQFLGQMSPPDVDSITGLSPAIAIDQKTTSRNPRSTVGTVTEIYDYLRLLYGRVATAYCPESGEKLEAQSAEKISDTLLRNKEKAKIHVLAPIIQNAKGEHKELLKKYLGQGFSRIRFNGDYYLIDEDIPIDKNKRNNLEVVIDRLVVKKGIKSRLNDSIEMALKLGQGSILVDVDGDVQFFSENYFSFKTGKSYPALEPRLFSFNSPIGACKVCNGLGQSKVFKIENMIIDKSWSINEGGIGPLAKKNTFIFSMVKNVAKQEKVSLDTALMELPKEFMDLLFHGSDKVYNFSFRGKSSRMKFKKRWVGLKNALRKKYYEAGSDKVQDELEEFTEIETCPECNGGRLTPFALAARIKKKGIQEITEMSIEEASDFFQKVKFTGHEAVVAKRVMKEIKDRLSFLLDVGLNYLTLARQAGTLSGGEAQRIRLATQIGSALTGVLYVLDEPSIGLHQRDNDKLIKTLRNLCDLGNTVLVVEHDEDTMMASDYLIDMGPGAGLKGGLVVAEGTPVQVKNNKKSITGQYLKGEIKIETPIERRKTEGEIIIKKAELNNIKGLDVTIPLRGFITVTGVSGSGKSTLIHQVLVPAIYQYLRDDKPNKNAPYRAIKGLSEIDSMIELDQSPIGRTPKSNPATYTKLFDDIRTVYSMTNDAKVRGYKPGRFSFNVKGGRCETCEGHGVIKVEMNFLPDVFVQCEDCDGKRYNSETLSILYRGKSIADVLKMTVDEAEEFFVNHKKIHRALKTLKSVGLGYLPLGQSSTTLSGGESQRLKLSRELAKNTRGHCFYILDEPTTGLHFKDIQILLKALNALVDQGHTVLVIEHNLDMIKSADYIIDLGPEGGDKGGELVAVGTPEEVAKNKKSHTGYFLKKVLK